MTDEELLAIVEQHESLAISGELDDERAKSIDLYMGRPYGDEMEGRSQVVMRDVADTVEWIKPSLLKVFCAGDDIVSFAPRGPEDDEQAQQETDYCNYVLMQQNNGFMIFHDWFHDALLQRNGYVLAEYKKTDSVETERYSNLSPEEVALLSQDVEIVAASVTDDGTTTMEVRRKYESGCVKVRCYPPERVIVSAMCPDVDVAESDFVELIELTTPSKMREAGFDVPDDIQDNSRNDWEYVAQRRRFDDLYEMTEETGDKATRTIKCRRIWVRADYDGDGIAELRRMVVVGSTVLENEEDDLIPVAALTPIRMPHEHIGMSVTDLVQDLQRIRTALTRGFLDNMYLANNGRYGIDASIVNIDDMLNSRPGGMVRVQGSPGNAIFPLLHPQNGGQIIQAIEYIDTVRENRTGVTKYNQGIDANSLNKTASGITQIMNASQQRIELIARIFAETGVKSLMRLIQALSIKNGRKQEIIKLRNKWVPVNPGEWKRRTDMTVSVGLGVGNKDQNLMHLQNILMAQKEGLAIGVATPQNIYNALTKLTQNAGFKNIDDFWTDPGDKPMQQNTPPEVQKEQIRVQADAQKFQAQSQQDQQKLAVDTQQKELDRQADIAKAVEVEKIKQAGETERTMIEVQAQREGVSLGAQVNFRQPELDSVAESIKGTQDQMAQAIGMLAQAQVTQAELLSGILRATAAPKQAIRDANGVLIGVQPVIE